MSEMIGFGFMLVLMIVGYITVFGGIGYLLGKPKGLERVAFWFGIFGGPIGWVLPLMLPRTTEDEAEDERLRDHPPQRLCDGLGSSRRPTSGRERASKGHQTFNTDELPPPVFVRTCLAPHCRSVLTPASNVRPWCPLEGLPHRG